MWEEAGENPAQAEAFFLFFIPSIPNQSILVCLSREFDNPGLSFLWRKLSCHHQRSYFSSFGVNKMLLGSGGGSVRGWPAGSSAAHMLT